MDALPELVYGVAVLLTEGGDFEFEEDWLCGCCWFFVEREGEVGVVVLELLPHQHIHLCFLRWVLERVYVSLGSVGHVVLQFQQHAGFLPDLELYLVLQEVSVFHRLLHVQSVVVANFGLILLLLLFFLLFLVLLCGLGWQFAGSHLVSLGVYLEIVDCLRNVMLTLSMLPECCSISNSCSNLERMPFGNLPSFCSSS